MADDDASLSRPRRQSSKKQKKLELLERMKSTMKSGKKNKYEIGELENVYEEVDEREYTKKVLERQEEDWIIDDDGCGYIEDGREIFDDDLDEESINQSKNQKTGKKRSRSSISDSPLEGRKGNIRNMLVNMPAKKKKESEVNLDEDDILGDIIGEIDSKAQSSILFVKPAKKAVPEISAKDYLKSFSTNRPLKPSKPQPLSEKNITIKTEKNEQPDVVKDITPDSPPIKIKQEPMDIEETKEPENVDEFESYDFGQIDIEVQAAENFKPAGEKEAIVDDEVLESKPLIKLEKDDNDCFSDWNKSEETNSNCEYINVDKSKLPLTMNEDGVQVLRFFYWDAHEEIYSHPGIVYLFGKVWVEAAKSFVSCCVTVKNINRQVFLLPREKRIDLKTREVHGEVSLADVYEEFNSTISTQYKIKEFRSRSTSKKYAFGEEDIPLESEYLEIRYSASCPALPNDLKGQTFSHVFGTKSSFLELLLLERGLKGPSWVDIVNPEPSNSTISWCKIEAICSKPINLKVVKNNASNEIPPLVVLTLLPQALYNPKTKQSEIVALACLGSNNYSVDKPPSDRLFQQHFCVLSRPSDMVWPFDIKEEMNKFKKTHIEKMDSERALLNFFLTKLYRIDPDIIVGHDMSGYGVSLLLERMALHKVPNWSRIGRLKRSAMPSSKSKQQVERLALTGRLLCDIKVSAKELIRSRSYDLDTLCQNVLNFKEGKRPDMTDDDFKMCYSNSSNLINAVWLLMSDASYILRILVELNVLPLALQITNIAGNVMSRTLMGGRSERNEYLLLHAFYNKDFIVPDKEYKKNIKKEDEDNGEEDAPKKASKKKPSYAGGLVLDPKVGFYDDLILLMDFNSLYPSIIQEYNICFTTMSISNVAEEELMDNYHKYLPEDTAEPGILPTEIRKLVESRKGVKQLLKTANLAPELKMQYDIRQMALKLTANSMYGCLGFSMSRFYAKPLAAIVTAKGREILLNTKKMVESYGYEVIYGDTDSLMINTKTKEFDQVHQIGRKIKTEVNKCYKQVELDIDGIFKYMLLLRKKKYAAVTVNKLPNGEVVLKNEMKGLDIVRRDWSQLSAETGNFVLKQILCDHSADDRVESIHGYLENIKQDLENGKVPLSLLTVTKQLTKPPEDYVDAKGLPHVQVALRMNKTTSKRLKQGDTVSYIICEDGTNNPATQRAYHIDELKTNNSLKIDVLYYLSQQIHPVIARLCDPIEGTDAASIARCLGLDPSLYARRNQIQDDEYGESIFGKKDEERFKDCKTFSFKCKNENCGAENIIEGPLRKNNNGLDELILEQCSNPNCNVRPMDYLPYIQNKLQLNIREHTSKYAEGWLLCEDPVCNHRTTQINSVFEGAYPLCPKCEHNVMHREVTSLQIYNQLCYYSYMFDLLKVSSKANKFDPDTYSAYRKVHEQVDQVLKINKYSSVNLAKLFTGIFPVKK